MVLKLSNNFFNNLDSSVVFIKPSGEKSPDLTSATSGSGKNIYSPRSPRNIPDIDKNICATSVQPDQIQKKDEIFQDLLKKIRHKNNRKYLRKLKEHICSTPLCKTFKTEFPSTSDGIINKFVDILKHQNSEGKYPAIQVILAHNLTIEEAFSITLYTTGFQSEIKTCMQKGLTSKLKSQEILYGSRQTFLFFRDVIQEIKKGIEKLPPYQSSKKDSENDLPPQLMLELPFYGSQKYKKQDVICYNEFASIEVHDQEKNNVKKEKKDKGFLPIVSLSEHSKVKDISAFSKNKQLLALPGITFTLLKWKATENEGKENIFVPLEKKHNTLPLKDSLNSSSLITEERSVGSQLKFLAGKLAPKKY